MATVIEEKEKFEFTSGAKKQIITTIVVGLVLAVVGLILFKMFGIHDAHGAHEGGHHAAASEAEGHHLSVWAARLVKDLWQTNIFFTGIAVMGTFWVAFNYVAWAGWSASIQRVPMSFGWYVPFSAVVTIILLLVFGHDLFHWMDPSLTSGTPESNPHYDEVIASKTWYLNNPFFWSRTLVYFALWFFFWWKIRQNAQKEDEIGGDQWWHKNTIVGAGFLVIWGVTESTSAWDWVMSIDPHFYSTMFGWYVFASWFVSAIAFITLFVLFLKDAGYLKMVTADHFHDLGKFMFAFSIFWTYVWFEQFLLIYYANIPEESLYFVIRLKSDPYMPFFFFSLFINFIFPFLWLMTRGSKRQGVMLKVVAAGIIFGHWIDFYNMMTPPIMKEYGGFDFYFLLIEVGIIMVFLGAFLFLALTALSRINLIPKNHPMIEES